MTRILGWLACVGAVALLIVAMVTGVAPATAAGAEPRVSGAWIRLAAAPGRPAAGYFTLAAGDAPAELIAVTSLKARIELHAMSMAGDVMRMDTLPSVRVAATRTVRFAPGGSHLMIFGLPAGVLPGSTLPLTFTFADGTKLNPVATVVAAGADAMPAMR